MPTYVTYAPDNSISAAADWAFPGSVQVDFEVVQGPDGKLYRQGEVPEKSLAAYKHEAMERIDAETSATILGGFFYAVDEELLHFSYDQFDQGNFADTANVATLILSGTPGLPETVTWNAYRNWTQETGGELVRLVLTPAEFLTLYTAGALAHKAACMEVGGQRKAAVAAAETIEALRAEIEGTPISTEEAERELESLGLVKSEGYSGDSHALQGLLDDHGNVTLPGSGKLGDDSGNVTSPGWGYGEGPGAGLADGGR